MVYEIYVNQMEIMHDYAIVIKWKCLIKKLLACDKSDSKTYLHACFQSLNIFIVLLKLNFSTQIAYCKVVLQ